MYSIRSLGLLVALAFVLPACADVDSTAPLAPADASLASSGPVLVECPVETEESTTGSLGALGGSIQLKGHRLSLPSLAVKRPTEFGLAASVSNYMELDIRGDGQNSFKFDRPVRITIDYSRCTRTNIDHAPLSVWQIDPETKALIEYMGGVDDKENRTVTFDTDHLSTYSIAQ